MNDRTPAPASNPRPEDPTLQALQDNLPALARTVRYCARKLLASHQVEETDLVHSAWLSGRTHIDTLRDEDKVLAWQRSTVRHMIQDHIADWRRRPQSASNDPAVHDPPDERGNDPLNNAASNEQLRLAVQDIPRELHETFSLRFVKGRSWESISEQLGVNVNTLRVRTSRALHKLRAEHADDAPEETPDAPDDEPTELTDLEWRAIQTYWRVSALSRGHQSLRTVSRQLEIDLPRAVELVFSAKRKLRAARARSASE